MTENESKIIGLAISVVVIPGLVAFGITDYLTQPGHESIDRGIERALQTRRR